MLILLGKTQKNMSKPAATLGCHHTCPIPKHVGGAVTQASANVFTENIAACRQGDALNCNRGTDVVAAGSQTVYINSRQAARLGDPTAHGGQIVEGKMSVYIG